MGVARTLRVGVDTAPRVFDCEQPAGFRDSAGSDLVGSFYDQLTSPRAYLDERGVARVDWHAPRPVLAEAWWWSEDGRTCTFRVRAGVLSADGNELTAEDVRWGWERAFGLRDVGKWVARVSSVQEAEDIEVLDRYTVAFHLRAPNPALPRTMAQMTPGLYDGAVVRPALSEDDPWAKELIGGRSVGFGPYRLVERDGDGVTIAAHERYWRGPAPIGEVRMRRYDSREEALEGLLAGEVDLVPGVPAEALPRLIRPRAAAPRLRVAPASLSGVALHLDPTVEPLDDPLVRQAIAHATPYEAVLASAFDGRSERWHSWVRSDSPGYDPTSWPYAEDLPRARELLAASKGAGGFETTLRVLPGDGFDAVAEVVADGLARIGVRLLLDEGDSAGAIRSGNLAPIMLRGFADGRGMRVSDPNYAYIHDWGPGRMRLFPFHYENEEFFDALRAIPEAGHGRPWEEAVRRAQRIHNADAVLIPLCDHRYYVAHVGELEGYRWYPDNRLPFAEMQWAEA